MSDEERPLTEKEAHEMEVLIEEIDKALTGESDQVLVNYLMNSMDFEVYDRSTILILGMRLGIVAGYLTRNLQEELVSKGLEMIK